MKRMMKKGLMMTYYYASSSRSSSSLRVRRSICSEAGLDEELVVKVRSESLLKPSSSTPLNRRHFKLSLIDAMFFPAMYPSFVLFYPPPNNNNNNSNRISRLRDSLSKALSHLYPLAGRIHLHQHAPVPSSIHCNDQGVIYLEAEANQPILHFLNSKAPDPQLLRRLSPPRPKSVAAFFSDAPPPLAGVQTTVFPCGGMAVGISFSHVIGDSKTVVTLLNKWASFYSGAADDDDIDIDDDPYGHDISGRSLFPMENFDITNIVPYDLGSIGSTITSTGSSSIGTGSISTRTGSSSIGTGSTSTGTSVVIERLVFEREAISKLKAQVGGQISNPSRALVIFGLIWKAAMHAHIINTNNNNNNNNNNKKKKKKSAALVTVNLRSRFKTPLPDYVMGNILWSNAAYSSLYEEEVELERLVGMLRKAVEEVDGEFVEKVRGEKGHGEIRKWVDERRRSSGGRVKEYHFSSNLKVGYNEVDFGWGRPMWVSFLGISEVLFPNIIVLTEGTDLDGGGGGGAVEAWVSLYEKEMALFLKDTQLLNYALINPKLRL